MTQEGANEGNDTMLAVSDRKVPSCISLLLQALLCSHMLLAAQGTALRGLGSFCAECCGVSSGRLQEKAILIVTYKSKLVADRGVMQQTLGELRGECAFLRDTLRGAESESYARVVRALDSRDPSAVLRRQLSVTEDVLASGELVDRDELVVYQLRARIYEHALQAAQQAA